MRHDDCFHRNVKSRRIPSTLVRVKGRLYLFMGPKSWGKSTSLRQLYGTLHKQLIDSAKNLVEGRSSKVIQEVQNLIWSKCSWSFVFAIGPQIVDTKIRMRMKGWHKKRRQAQDAEPS